MNPWTGFNSPTQHTVLNTVKGTLDLVKNFSKFEFKAPLARSQCKEAELLKTFQPLSSKLNVLSALLKCIQYAPWNFIAIQRFNRRVRCPPI